MVFTRMSQCDHLGEGKKAGRFICSVCVKKDERKAGIAQLGFDLLILREDNL